MKLKINILNSRIHKFVMVGIAFSFLFPVLSYSYIDNPKLLFYIICFSAIFSSSLLVIIAIIQEKRNMLYKQRSEELEKSREESEKLVKAKSEYLANMTHEIRTPLNGILGITEALLEEELSEKQIEYMDLINYSGRNLLTIINEVLDHSKLEVNKVRVNNHSFKLDTLIEVVKSCFTIQAESKGIEFIVQKSPSAPEVIISDDTRIFQVLNNIIGNAIKFTNEGYVKLVINHETEDDGRTKLIFYITDTGIGLTPGEIEKLYVPFEQANSSTDRLFGGTGLGLSIVHEILKLMGGTIDVVSSKDTGTEFKVTLYYEEANMVPMDEVSDFKIEKDVDFAKICDISILVAEDNLINQKVINVLLNKLGYQPDFANNGYEVLEALEYKKYDLILMDMLMPKLDGVETAKLISKKDSEFHPYMIALTGNSSDEDRLTCLRAGMQDFLTKPITTADLKRVITIMHSKTFKKAA